MNRVCEILGITKPVIQAPMAWITSSDLVAAVSNAGGLGVLGTSADFTEIIKGVDETIKETAVAIRIVAHRFPPIKVCKFAFYILDTATVDFSHPKTNNNFLISFIPSIIDI